MKSPESFLDQEDGRIEQTIAQYLKKIRFKTECFCNFLDVKNKWKSTLGFKEGLRFTKSRGLFEFSEILSPSGSINYKFCLQNELDGLKPKFFCKISRFSSSLIQVSHFITKPTNHPTMYCLYGVMIIVSSSASFADRIPPYLQFEYIFH